MSKIAPVSSSLNSGSFTIKSIAIKAYSSLGVLSNIRSLYNALCTTLVFQQTSHSLSTCFTIFVIKGKQQHFATLFCVFLILRCLNVSALCSSLTNCFLIRSKRQTIPLNCISLKSSSLKSVIISFASACYALASQVYTSLICCLIARSLITLKTIVILLLYLRPFSLSLRSVSFLSTLLMKLDLWLNASALAFFVPFL